MAAEDEERIEVIAILRDELSRPADRAADKVERLGDESEDTKKDLHDLGDEIDRTKKKTDDLNESLDDNTDAHKKNAHWTKQNRDEKGRFIKSTKKSTREVERETKAFGGLLKVGFKFRSLFRFAMWGTIADGITFLGTAIKGLGAASYAAVAGLTPLTGMLVSYPGLLAAGIQGLAAFKFATKGIGEAVQTMNDPNATAKELHAALKDLTREQVLFARSIADTKEETKQLRQEVSSAFFSGLDRQVDMMARIYFPVLNRELGKTASKMNEVVTYTGQWLSKRRQVKNIESLMDSQSYIIEQLGKGGSDFFRGLLWILRAAQPMMRMMSKDFRGLMADFADWAQHDQKNIRKFFKGSYKLFKDTMDVLGDFIMGLYNIGAASDEMSNYLGDSFTDMGKHFRKWTESTEGRKSIKQFFHDMIPVTEELGLWVRDISKTLSDMTMDNPKFLELSRTLRTQALPLIAHLFDSVSGKFIPLLNDLLVLANDMVDAGVTDAMVGVMDDAVWMLDHLVRAIDKLPDPLSNTIFQLGALFTLLRVSGILGMFKGRRLAAVTGKGGVTGGLSPIDYLLLGGGGAAGEGGKHAGRGGSSGRRGMRGGILSPRGPGRHVAPRVKPKVRLPKMKNLAMKGRGMLGPLAWLLDVPLPALGALGNEQLPTMVPDIPSGNMKALDKFIKMTNLAQNGNEHLGETLGILDDRFVDLAKKDPEKTYKGLKDMAKKTGLTMEDINKLLPKTRDALKDTLNRGSEPLRAGLNRLKKLGDQLGDSTFAPKISARVDRRGINNALDIFFNAVDTSMGTYGRGLGVFKLDQNPQNYWTPRFAGGETSGKGYLTGEMGPELWVSRSGAMKMLGIHGPEFAHLGPGAVLPASATADPFHGHAGNAPDWAVEAARRAAGGLGSGLVPGSGSSGSQGTSGAYSGPLVNIENITATSDVDVEGAVLRAIRKAEREKEERS